MSTSRYPRTVRIRIRRFITKRLNRNSHQTAQSGNGEIDKILLINTISLNEVFRRTRTRIPTHPLSETVVSHTARQKVRQTGHSLTS